MQDLYDMFFKRKSFRRFDEKLSLSKEEIMKIETKLYELIPLISDIKVKYRIVKKEETTCRRGEYCLLVYSESKENYLLNIGYMLEQLDLWMASENIGACWYGMGKTNELQFDGLDYVIMLAFGKGELLEFRKDYTKAKRKELDIIWNGSSFVDVANIVRYAPSSCNSQPWRVLSKENNIQIFRSTQISSIIPKDKQAYYNSIDIGIFICFMDITLSKKCYQFKRMLYAEPKSYEDLVPIASYNIFAEPV